MLQSREASKQRLLHYTENDHFRLCGGGGSHTFLISFYPDGGGEQEGNQENVTTSATAWPEMNISKVYTSAHVSRIAILGGPCHMFHRVSQKVAGRRGSLREGGWRPELPWHPVE